MICNEKLKYFRACSNFHLFLYIFQRVKKISECGHKQAGLFLFVLLHAIKSFVFVTCQYTGYIM